MDALAAQCDRIHMLGFVAETPTTPVEELAAALSAQWGVPLRLTLVRRTPNPAQRNAVQLYAPGILSADRQEHYENIRHPAQIAAVRQALAAQPRIVLAHRLPVFTPLFAAQPAAGLPILFDMDDIEHRAATRRLLTQPRWPSERLRLLQMPALMLREARALRRASESYVCSESDAQSLRRLFACPRVHAIANAVPAPVAAPPLPEQPGLGFIGSFVHPPNVDAARRLIAEVWPRIHAAVPHAQLYIAGDGAKEALGPLATAPGVTVLGFVDALSSFYERVSLLCAPIRYGAGTRVKIIEAAAWGRAHVTTPLGAEGLDFAPTHEIALADTPQAQAQACIGLLQGDGAARMGAAARARHALVYDRDAIVATLSARIGHLLA